MKSRTIIFTDHPSFSGLIAALRARGHRVISLTESDLPELAIDAFNQGHESSVVNQLAWMAAFREFAASARFHLSGDDLSEEVVACVRELVLTCAMKADRIKQMLDALHDQHGVDLLVVHNDVADLIKVMLHWAHSKGIPTLHLPHGISVVSYGLPDLNDRTCTSWLGAQGQAEVDWFAANPANESARTVLLGRPEWDGYYEAQPLTRDVRLGLQLKDDALVVAFVGTWPMNLTTGDVAAELRMLFEKFLRSIHGLRDDRVVVLVRPHPAYRVLNDYGPGWYRGIARECGVEIQIPDVTPECFLAAADLVVGVDSSLLIPALILHRLALSIAYPVVSARNRSGYSGLPGIATCQADEDAITDALRSCLFDEEFKARLRKGRDETVKHFNFGNDGRATQRTTDFVESLLRASSDQAIEAGGYYSRINQRLAAMVPETARRILEVGCGAGYLGAWLKAQNPTRVVVGVEAFAAAAAEARLRLDRVVEGDVENLALEFPPGYFDCIIYGDVLEHLRDPEAVLLKHREALAFNGVVLACVPNVAHWSVLYSMLRGQFEYADEGLLDRTHLRFFTKDSFSALLARAGFRILASRAIDSPHPVASQALVSCARHLGITDEGLARNFEAYQLLFAATHAQPVKAPFVLPDALEKNILLIPEDLNQILSTAEAFIALAGQESQIALHVFAGEALQQVQASLLKFLFDRGLDPEQIPRVVLHDQAVTCDNFEEVLTTGVVLISERITAQRASEFGVPAATALTGEVWAQVTGEINAPLANASNAPLPLVSIVVLTLNQLSVTQQCLESVFRYQSVPFELIVIDNGSTDATQDWLGDLAAADDRVVLRLNPCNTGFAYACNQGIAAARGEVVVFLNNDTVVTEGWLDGLLRPFALQKRVGMVGPATNLAQSTQRLTQIDYDAEDPSLGGLAAFAEARANRFTNQGENVSHLVGFCLAVTRDVLRQVGGFDIAFGSGKFEDNDLCIRVLRAGYKLWFAHDVYIHHWGARTFRAENIDYRRLMQTNQSYFLKKWEMQNHEFESERWLGKALSLPVVSDRDIAPVLVHDMVPVPLDTVKNFRFLLMLDGCDVQRLTQALSVYRQNFSVLDDCCLVLWLREERLSNFSELFAGLENLLGAIGLLEDSAPEVLLLRASDDAITLGQFLKSCQAWVSVRESEIEGYAKVCGLHVLPVEPVTGWHTAMASPNPDSVPHAVRVEPIGPEQSIAFITCVDDEALYRTCLEHIRQLHIPDGMAIEFIAIRDATSMTEAYNQAMGRTAARYKVYLHQDVFILNRHFIRDVVTIFRSSPHLGLLGMVGVAQLPESNVWWEGRPRYGVVYEHRSEKSLLAFDEVRDEWQEVVAVDGLMLVTQYDVQWNEGIKGFHLYDTAHCQDMRQRGYRVGVPRQIEPWVLHHCGHEFNESAYREGLRQFAAIYKH